MRQNLAGRVFGGKRDREKTASSTDLETAGKCFAIILCKRPVECEQGHIFVVAEFGIKGATGLLEMRVT